MVGPYTRPASAGAGDHTVRLVCDALTCDVATETNSGAPVASEPTNGGGSVFHASAASLITLTLATPHAGMPSDAVSSGGTVTLVVTVVG